MGGGALNLVVVAAAVGAALCLILGMLLLATGLRGRRLDRHPVCRKCRFDLDGIFPGREVCPECGAGLERRRAVRVGNRRKRRGVLATGALLLIVGLAGASYLGYEAAGHVQWVRVKPVWWLRLGADGADAAAAEALTELARRIDSGRIGSKTARALGEAILERQADGSTWTPECAPVFEAAYRTGAMTDEEFGTYAERAVAIATVTRTTARAGAPLRIWFHTSRSPTGAGATIKIQHIATRVLLNGEETLQLGHVGGTGFKGAWGGGSIGLDLPSTPTMPGPCEIVAEIQLGFHPDVEVHADYVATGSVTCRTLVELVGPEVELVTLVDDSVMIELMANKTSVKVFDAVRWGEVVHLRLQYGLERGSPPVAYDVYLRSGDREWAADGFTAGPGPTGSGGFAELPGDFDSEVVDVIFRPSVTRAEQSSSLVEILGGEFVIEGVPVQWREQ